MERFFGVLAFIFLQLAAVFVGIPLSLIERQKNRKVARKILSERRVA